MPNKLTAPELQEQLAHCYCSETHYKHWLGIRYTEGVKTLAEGGGCYWLLDAIASYQPGKVIKGNPNLRDFQLWLLTVNLDQSAVLACHEDSPDSCEPVITQDFPSTNFPLPEIKLYLENGVLFLPTER